MQVPVGVILNGLGILRNETNINILSPQTGETALFSCAAHGISDFVQVRNASVGKIWRGAYDTRVEAIWVEFLQYLIILRTVAHMKCSLGCQP